MRELTWNLLYLRWLHWSFHRRKPGLTSRRSNPDLEGRTGPSFRQSESAPQTVQIEKHDKSTPKSRHTENPRQDITKAQYIVLQHLKDGLHQAFPGLVRPELCRGHDLHRITSLVAHYRRCQVLRTKSCKRCHIRPIVQHLSPSNQIQKHVAKPMFILLNEKLF